MKRSKAEYQTRKRLDAFEPVSPQPLQLETITPSSSPLKHRPCSSVTNRKRSLFGFTNLLSPTSSPTTDPFAPSMKFSLHDYEKPFTSIGGFGMFHGKRRTFLQVLNSRAQSPTGELGSAIRVERVKGTELMKTIRQRIICGCRKMPMISVGAGPSVL